MSKAKLLLILAAVLVCSLAFAAPALAWTHGQFSATTDACAGCHVAHAAQAPKLLKAGPTQTTFCFLCHGDGCVSAPYDVEDGYTKPTVGFAAYASTAGGFVNQFVDADSDGVVDAGELTAIKSRHTVEGYLGDTTTAGAWNGSSTLTAIPGSPYEVTGTAFRCGSCHDPHDGGRVPDGTNIIGGSASSANPRLLRRSITISGATYSDLYVGFKFWSTVGTFTYGSPSVDSGVYRVTEYVYGSTNYCGACHNIFDVGTDSGHTLTYGMYRHAFDVELTTDYVTSPNDPSDTTLNGTPLEKGASGTLKRVACLTCHRAHSTTASAAGWASSWPRDSVYDSGGTSSTSALLRMDNRGVCFNCHGAAVYNKPT